MTTGLFARLKQDNQAGWKAYTEHPFVAGLADGSLPTGCFKYYLGQDYLFLIHFARAQALAAYKSDNLTDIRNAAAGLSAIVDMEMDLHVKFSAAWGLTEAEMEALPEADGTLAYTRFVLERGAAGDVLDLHVALAPCIIGYAEIGVRLAKLATPANPYRDWIGMYASDDYQALAVDEIETLNRLFSERGGEGRYPFLARDFGRAVQLECGFWQMGLDAGNCL